jgi:hypothetical protein
LALNHGYAAELGDISSSWLFHLAKTLNIPPGTKRTLSSSSHRNIACSRHDITALCEKQQPSFTQSTNTLSRNYNIVIGRFNIFEDSELTQCA